MYENACKKKSIKPPESVIPEKSPEPVIPEKPPEPVKQIKQPSHFIKVLFRYLLQFPLKKISKSA